MARIPYLDRQDLAESDRAIFDRITIPRSVGGNNSRMPNFRRALLNSPRAAEVVGRLGDYVSSESKLDPVAREIAILSVAREIDSHFEWAHHEPVARRVGVRDETIESIKSGRAPMGLPAKEGVFAQAAKEVAGKGTMTERTFQAILHLLGPAGTVDLIVLAGYYAMLGGALSALEVELEPALEDGLGAG